jgi:hypothetical protein
MALALEQGGSQMIGMTTHGRAGRRRLIRPTLRRQRASRHHHPGFRRTAARSSTSFETDQHLRRFN